MKSPSLSPAQTPRLWSGHLHFPLPCSDLPFKDKRPSGGITGGLRVTVMEWGDASTFYQMVLSLCFKSCCILLSLCLSSSSSLLIKVFPTHTIIFAHHPHSLILTLFIHPTSPVSVVKGGVVIIALVIPYSYNTSEYTSDPRRLRICKKHSQWALPCLYHFFFQNHNFRVLNHASKNAKCMEPRILNVNQENLFMPSCSRNTRASSMFLSTWMFTFSKVDSWYDS